MHDDSLHGCKLASIWSDAMRPRGFWVEFEVRTAGLYVCGWTHCFCSEVVGAVGGCDSHHRDGRRSASIGGGKDRRQVRLSITLRSNHGCSWPQRTKRLRLGSRASAYCEPCRLRPCYYCPLARYSEH